MDFETVTLIDGQHATIKELQLDASRAYTSGDNPTASVRYRGAGYANTSDAYTAINALLYTDTPLAPFTRGTDGKPRFHGLPVTSIEVTQLAAANLFDITVNCSVPNVSNSAGVNDNPGSNINDPGYTPPAIEDSQFSFDVATFSAHVDRGRGVITRARYDGGTPLEFEGIGPQTDGRFTGAEMLVPSVSMTITRSEPRWYMNPARRLLLANLTGTVNAVEFAGYLARSVMFAGVSTQRKWIEYNAGGGTVKDWYWSTAYRFNVRPSSILDVGGASVPVGAWDVVSYEDGALKADGMTPVFTPGQVSVWALYATSDFNLLGLMFPA